MGTLLQNKINMKILQVALLGSLLQIGACARGQVSQQETRWVDDILFDSALDDPNFKLCNTEEQVIQYFNDGKSILYEGGKPAIDAIFSAGYQPVAKNESGLVRIRFIVNCLGETGRFRLMSSGLDYQPFEFSPKITDQLLELTKSMKGWKPKIWKDLKVDYYQYLVFKVEAGKLTHILP